MRRNLIVLAGVVMVLLSPLLPMFSMTVDGVENIYSPRSNVNLIVLGIILFIMIFKWRWRGIVWILLSLFAATVIPQTLVEIIKVFFQISIALSPSTAPVLGKPVFQSGMYVLIGGYLVITSGAIWDLVQKLNPQPAPVAIEPIHLAQPKVDAPETHRLSFLCDFADGRREVIGMPNIEKATVGSGSTDDIRTNPEKSTVSQAVVKRARTFYYLDVLDKTFPTLLNGQLVTSSRKLVQGDVLAVGDVAILIRLPA